ncbi:MAG: trans-aconitate 2-methyltransferase [Alphaproteobacteria bacterium]|nr:trans-aconitate 2-methyltransferase [Alphaproteobacteria bacterium]
MTDWNPDHYLKFADERTRPARDLLAQVPLAAPDRIYDLGCGPGNSTALLVARYGRAHVTGIDNSAAMLEKARSACPAAHFAHGDLTSWTPPEAPDLLFSNATFQWVPDHVSVLERLLRGLRAGAVLAVQMPDNLQEPSHRLMSEVAGQGPWTEKLAGAPAARDMLPTPSAYYARLRPLSVRIEIWHTIYNHPLAGPRGIVDWLASTGLRPFLAPLDDAGQAEFLKAYEAELAKAYPVNPDGTVLLRFPRLFLVAVRA